MGCCKEQRFSIALFVPLPRLVYLGILGEALTIRVIQVGH